MDIYFIRHGQTFGNAAKRHQHNDSRLTPLGQQQAERAATTIAAIDPTHLIVSARVRAVETGQAVAYETGLVPEVSELVVELYRPKALYGNYHRSPQTFSYLLRWFFGELGGVGDVPEGESYNALLDRIAGTKEMLAQYPADARVVVVSHSVFINMFVAHRNHPGRLRAWRGFWALMRSLMVRNGSITHLVYDPSRKNSWQLQRFGRRTV